MKKKTLTILLALGAVTGQAQNQEIECLFQKEKTKKKI